MHGRVNEVVNLAKVKLARMRRTRARATSKVRVDRMGFVALLFALLFVTATSLAADPQTADPRINIQQRHAAQANPELLQQLWTVVPDLQGHRRDEVQKMLADAGLQLGTVGGGVGAGELGTVMSQRPLAQARVTRGSSVDIILIRSHPETQDGVATLTTVPNLIGTPIDGANQTLQAARLQLGRTAPVESQQGEPGTIIRQRPLAGTQVPYGSRVDLLFLKSTIVTSMTVVPDLQGQRADEVRKILADAGLGLGNVVGGVAAGELGTVMSQSPQAQTRVTRGSKVDVVLVRSHPGTQDGVTTLTTVPNLIGTPIDAANRTLQAARLQLGSTLLAESQQGEPGTVIRQRPPAGTQVPYGSRVEVLVVNQTMVTVPDLRGFTVADAERRLEAERLGLGTVTTAPSSAQDPGTLLAQEPAPGARVPSGTSVNITLAGTPPLAVVPDLKGHKLSEAAQMLELRALRLGRGSERPTNEVAPGIILDQKPSAGQKVRNGTEVNVLVAQGLPTIAVPNVVGRTQGDAEQTLENAGLHVGGLSERKDQGQAGTVMVQNPNPGALLPVGSAIDLVLSSGQPVTVYLHAEPSGPTPEQPVKLYARVDPALPHMSYQFFFGDGLASDWLPEPVVEHRYKAQAQYQARVVVQAGAREYSSAPLLLTVNGGRTVILHADKRRSEKNQDVLFTATVEPAFPGAEYKFAFGDGSETEWSRRAESRHAYSGSGTYQAYVFARVRGSEVRSMPVGVEIPDSIPWILIAAVAVLGGVVLLGLLVRIFRTPSTPPPDVNDVNVRPLIDPGKQWIASVSNEEAGPAVEIRAVTARGVQTVELEEALPELRKVVNE